MSLRPGDTFLLPKSASATEHLWIIVTEVDEVTRKAVCVNVTSRRVDSDTTVVIVVGEHGFIKHESVVYFADARETNIDEVEKLINVGTTRFVVQLHDPCSKALLERVKKRTFGI